MKKIINTLKKHKTFVITAHMNLEGDALGSELAMYLLLKKLRKKAVIYNNDPVPHVYKFLPSADVITTQCPPEPVDAALVLDCSDSSRTGKVHDYLSKVGTIVNIDHHISNTLFGDINWVNPTASSACEILYTLCKKINILDKDIAMCLYAGIYTDTGNFTYANTSPYTHQVAADLMKYGVNPNVFHDALYSYCVPKDLKFIGEVLTSLKYDAKKKICWAVLKTWRDNEYDLTEVVFTIMRLLRDVEVFLLFKQYGKNKVRVNFRSRAYVDVNKIAQFFGGGGHKRASGTTINDTLESTEKKVIQFVKRHVYGEKRPLVVDRRSGVRDRRGSQRKR